MAIETYDNQITGTYGNQITKTIQVTDNDYLLLIRDDSNAIIQAKRLVASNVSDSYVDLIGDDDTVYRLSVVNGQTRVLPQEVYTGREAQEGDNNLYDGLIINQMYGGGTAIVNTPISHSFIELYNLRGEDINLNGLYLWYRSKSSQWQSLKLEGIVPAYHSFLIRCGEHTNVNNENVIWGIRDYDQSWNIKLSDQGFSAYLCIGADTPEDNPVRQTVDATNGTITWTNGRYIDLLGAGGKASDQTVWAYETYYWHCMDNHTGVHRIDFANSGSYNIGSNKKSTKNNQGDVEALDYNKIDVSIYRPRCVKDGAWRYFYDKTQFKQNCPSAINIAFGEEGDVTRTFSFQTPISVEGYIRYREQDSSHWITIETDREVIKQGDTQVTLHKGIITGLTKGATYEYQVGYEGCWSDIETMEIKNITNSNPIDVLWTSDQQG